MSAHRPLLSKHRFTGGWVALGLCAAAGIALTMGAARWAERRAITDITAAAATALQVHAASLDGALEKYRILPALLARRRDVVAMFADIGDPAARQSVLSMAELQTAMTGASDVSFIAPDGAVLVSSTPGRAGKTVSRATPHILAALQGRLGRGFAGDGKSGGYTFASPVRGAAGIIGVVATTVGLERIERAWALQGDPIVAVDDFGFVYVTNRPDWRFRRLARRDVAEDITPALIEIGYRDDGTVSITEPTGRTTRYGDIVRTMPALGWTLHLFADLAPARAARANAALIAGLASMLALGALWALVERRRRLVARRRGERANALRLERRVRARTAALSASNAALAREVGERQQAEEQLRQAQSELIQAAKLAGLGQMSAILAHEFNQPLAAIRSLADNAQLLIARGRTADAEDNLRRIAALVARLGDLSKTLKTFARKPGGTIADVPLAEVIDHAILLLGPRLKDGRARLDLDLPATPVIVRAGQIRLEQVVVNLIANALDAVAGHNDGRVRVEIACIDGFAQLAVSDNGAGIAPDQRARVFDPFFTTKTIGEGLGLGLSIVYNIVKDFDGDITIDDAPQGGARFTVKLPLAAAANMAAE